MKEMSRFRPEAVANALRRSGHKVLLLDPYEGIEVR